MLLNLMLTVPTRRLPSSSSPRTRASAGSLFFRHVRLGAHQRMRTHYSLHPRTEAEDWASPDSRLHGDRAHCPRHMAAYRHLPPPPRQPPAPSSRGPARWGVVSTVLDLANTFQPVSLSQYRAVPLTTEPYTTKRHVNTCLKPVVTYL